MDNFDRLDKLDCRISMRSYQDGMIISLIRRIDGYPFRCDQHISKTDMKNSKGLIEYLSMACDQMSIAMSDHINKRVSNNG